MYRVIALALIGGVIAIAGCSTSKNMDSGCSTCASAQPTCAQSSGCPICNFFAEVFTPSPCASPSHSCGMSASPGCPICALFHHNTTTVQTETGTGTLGMSGCGAYGSSDIYVAPQQNAPVDNSGSVAPSNTGVDTGTGVKGDNDLQKDIREKDINTY